MDQGDQGVRPLDPLTLPPTVPAEFEGRRTGFAALVARPLRLFDLGGKHLQDLVRPIVITVILDPQLWPGIQWGEFTNSPGGILVAQRAGDALPIQQAENLLYDNQLWVGKCQLHGVYKGQLD